MGGYASTERADTEAVAVAVGGGAAAQGQGAGAPNDAAADSSFPFQTRGRGLFTAPDEEKSHVAISALLATFNAIDGQAAQQHTDGGAHNSPPGFEIDLESNSPRPVPPLAVYVGCLPRFFDFIVKHTKCVAIGSIVGNCCKVVMEHCTAADQGEELQERCYKYSQRALAFQTFTFIASCVAAPVVASSGTGSITILDVAAAGLLAAISIELLFTLTTKKTKLGRGLIYLSSSLVMSTTFLMFISFDKRYAYGVLSVPLLIVAAVFQHKLLPGAAAGVHDDEEAIQEALDKVFDTWAYILNLGIFVTLMFTYIVQAKDSSASVTGFLFMFTIVLGLFEMMVAAARPVALARLATYLQYLLILLFLGTLTSYLVTVAKSLV